MAHEMMDMRAVQFWKIWINTEGFHEVNLDAKVQESRNQI